KKNKLYFWGDCKKAPKKYFENLLLRSETFYCGSPVRDSIETVVKLHKEGFKIKIVTLPQYYSDTCIKEKVMWIEKHLSFLNIERDLIFTGEKSILAGENRVLLDDNINNLIEWKNQGGVAVAYTQPWNDKWKGLRVNNHKEFYKLIHQFQNNLINENIHNEINPHNLRSYYENKLYKGE
ncbi:5' nucleotidase, NT5C type, partial [Clostridium sporogenes]